MKFKWGMIAVALVLSLSACGNGKTNQTAAEEAADSLPPDETVNQGVVELQTSKVSDTVSWNGKVYHYSIVRRADKSLPRVKEEDTGTLFSDNHIDLNITCEGQPVFNKRFTKTTFTSFLDEGFRRNGVLEGLVFDMASSEGLRFATSVSYPHSDLYMPLVILIDSKGNMTINKDQILDIEEGADEGSDI